MIRNNSYQAHLNIEIAWEEMAGFVGEMDRMWQHSILYRNYDYLHTFHEDNLPLESIPGSGI